MDYPKIKLKAVRVNAGYTLDQAAKELSITKQTLIRYEHGTTTPSWDMVGRMSKLYNFPKDYIFFEPKTNSKLVNS